jgi:epoxyqueuosine reductase QueG
MLSWKERRMVDYSLTKEVKEFAIHQLGADIVGVGGADRFVDAPTGHHPDELLPGAKSVIVIAIRLLNSTFLSTNPRIYVQRYWQLRERFQDAGYEICRFLEDRGHFAINFPSTAPQDSGPVGKMLFADFSHRHAAQLAGIGQIGLNQLLITPQYGPRVWLMSVITTADLAPDPLMAEDICPGEECNVCVEKCPQNALSSEGIDRKKCLRGYGRFGLIGLLRLLKEIMEEKDVEKKKKLIFGPTTWTIWMVLHYGSGPSMCNACIASCPIAWNGAELPRISISAEAPTVPANKFIPKEKEA